MDLIPPPNGARAFNVIDGYTFDYAKEGVLVEKIDLESMLDESGFHAATEMVGFALENSQKYLCHHNLFGNPYSLHWHQ